MINVFRELDECKMTVKMYEEAVTRKASVEVPGVKVVVTREDNWDVIFMILFLVLGTYTGIKIINRIFKGQIWKR